MGWLLRSHVRLVTAALVACRAPDAAPAAGSADTTPGAAESAAVGDSALAVHALRAAIVALDPGQERLRFRVASFAPEGAGYRITLVPDSAMGGGGGRALVSRTGRVGRVEMFQ